VIVEPLRPKETPLLFEKTIEPRLPLVVPALKLTDAAAAANDAVICDMSLMPKVTPLESANRTVPLVAVCVPAAIPKRPPDSRNARVSSAGS
jgi:hypothetical protein